MWPPVDEESTPLCIGLVRHFPCIPWNGQDLLFKEMKRCPAADGGEKNFPVVAEWTGGGYAGQLLWNTTVRQ